MTKLELKESLDKKLEALKSSKEAQERAWLMGAIFAYKQALKKGEA